jgi:hypothetical protein
MFIIRTEADRLRCIDAIRDMPLYPVQQVKISDYKRNRTAEQNAAFHAWVKAISDHTGYTEEDVKYKLVIAVFEPEEKIVRVKCDDEKISGLKRLQQKAFKWFMKALDIVDAPAELREYIEKRIKPDVEYKNGYAEYRLIERRSTANLTVEEFCRLQDATMIVAHTLNISLQPYGGT